jgi:hypothetical protein
MKSSFPAALLLACALAPLGALADETRQSPAAPVAANEDAHVQPPGDDVHVQPGEDVHVQPRGPRFSPHSRAVDDVQRKQDDFIMMQQALDAMFDQKLVICRHC